MEGGDSAPASDIFCAKQSISPPFAPRAQRLMRMAEGRLVIRKLAQHRAVGLPQKGLKKCLDYRAPRACAGAEHLRTCFQQFYQNRGRHPCPCWDECAAARAWSEGWHSSVDSGTFFGCVRGSLLLFSKERLAVDAWNSSIFGHPPFCQKHFRQSQKKGNAKAKKRQDDLHGNS